MRASRLLYTFPLITMASCSDQFWKSFCDRESGAWGLGSIYSRFVFNEKQDSPLDNGIHPLNNESESES